MTRRDIMPKIPYSSLPTMTGYLGHVCTLTTTNDLHSQPRSSNTLSTSSDDHLRYPLTPPPLDHYRSPYACSPLPPVSGISHKPVYSTVGPVRINPILGLSQSPAIVWDLTLSWTSKTTVHYQRIPSHTLSEPATMPPRSSLTIISANLPWSIAIFSSSPDVDGYVTVGDVLNTLHHSLWLALADDQYKALPSREVRGMVSAAYERRIGHRRASEGHDRGMKRVDCLMGRNRFMGLSSTRFGPGVWALNVA